MNAKASGKNPNLYGYTRPTHQAENDADAAELYRMASKAKSKLVIFGGVHGWGPSHPPVGVPTGQDPDDKDDCSFSMGDRESKGVGKGIDFIYQNVARYTTDGSDVTLERQRDILELMKGHLDNKHYVLVSWCYSWHWLTTNALLQL